MAGFSLNEITRKRRAMIERWTATFTRVYRSIGAQYLSRVERDGISALLEFDDLDTKPLATNFVELHVDVGTSFALWSRRKMKTRKATEEDVEDEIYSVWVRDINEYTRTTTAKLIRTIQLTCEEEIKRIVGGIVQQGIKEGLPIEQLAKFVAEQFKEEWGEASKWMARRIAQTETIRASNYGVMKGVDSLGIPYVKSWLAADDERTRPSHFDAEQNNARIPQDQKFIVGGYECDFPADAALPPEESINCRCAWTAEPID